MVLLDRLRWKLGVLLGAPPVILQLIPLSENHAKVTLTAHNMFFSMQI